jgi:hypothetical protein
MNPYSVDPASVKVSPSGTYIDGVLQLGNIDNAPAQQKLLSAIPK